MQAVALRLRRGQQRRGRAGAEPDIGQQLGNIDELGGQSGTQHVIGVSHHLQRHAVQVGVRRFRKQKHRFARLQLNHVEQQRRKQAAVIGIFVGDKGDRLPRLTLMVKQRRFQHRQRARFFLIAQRQQAGEQLSQMLLVGLLQKMGDGRVGARHRLQQ